MKSIRWHHCLIGTILLAWVAIIVCLSTVPPVSRDALTHHLRVPQLYIDHGAMVELPDIKFSYYPMNLDMLYLVPLLWNNDIIPKYIHFAFALGTAALLYLFLTPRLGAVYGWFGVFFFLSLPIVVKLSITVYVDLGLVFFFSAAMLQLIRWAENGCRPHQLMVAGIYCGLGLGTKYNGLVGLILIAAAIPILRQQYTPTEQGVEPCKGRKLCFGVVLKDALWFSLAVLVLFSPWMIRNILWQGNPLYPLFDGWFNAESRVAVPKLDPLTLRRVVYGESLWEILTVPIRIFFQGDDNNPQLFDGRLSPFLLILPLVGMLSLRYDSHKLRTQKLFFFSFSVLFVIIAFFESHMRIRYIAPIIVPLIILSAYGLKNIAMIGWPLSSDGRPHHRPAFATWVAIGTGIFVIGMNLPYLYKQWVYVNPISYLSGQVDRDAYITKYRPEYELYRFGNAALDPDAKVFALFLGKRGYRFNRDIVFDNEGFGRLLAMNDDPISLGKALHQEGYSHLMINHRLFNHWVVSNLSEKQRRCVELFLRTAVRSLLTTTSGHVLYALVPEKVYQMPSAGSL